MSVKALSNKTAGPVVEWNYVFLLFWSQLVFLKSKGFLGILHLRYISCIQFFFFSFIQEGLSVTDQEGITS